MVDFISLISYPYDKKRLAKEVLGLLRTGTDQSVPVELTLGIRRNGKPDILLPKGSARYLGRNVPPPSNRENRYSNDFESLSPILFYTVEELSKKLTTISKKSTAKRFGNQDDGVVRGAFEHGRTVYCILQGRLDPSAYGLPGATWARSLKVVSFAFNTMTGDTRPSGERLLHPILLDVGWSEATIPDVTVKTGSVKDYRIGGKRFLNRGSERMDFEHGNTEELPSAEIAAKLTEVFQLGSMREPLVLLVHDEQLARNALRDFGINASTWESGLKGLLGYSTVKRESYSNRAYSSRPPVKQEDSDYRRPRSRSPSPRRSIKPDPDGPSYRSQGYSRRPSSPRRYNDRVYAPVYVVGIKQLYFKLMRMDDGGGSIVEMAQRLGMREEDEVKWCAGNEAVLLIQIWRSLIAGPPIDEHRVALDAGWIQAPAQSAQVAEAPAEDEDEEDRDPNDYVYDASTDTTRSADRPKAGMYETDSDDAFDSD